jgi:two-component system NtrC family sensor kinase
VRTSGPVGQAAPAPDRPSGIAGRVVALSAIGVAGLTGGVTAATGTTRGLSAALASMVVAIAGLAWLAGRATGRALALAEAETRAQAQQARRRSDRLMNVGQLAAGVAHELGTPLAVVAERARLITSHAGDDPALIEHALSIERQTRRMGALIRQLIDFGHAQRWSLAIADLRVIARGAVAQLAATAAQRGVDLVTELPATRVLINANAPRLHQALANLITNAIQAMPDGGTVTIGVRLEQAAAPDGAAAMRRCACCWIEDHGDGIPEEIISRIFEPFFTTRSLGEGSGLGLAVSHGIIQEHGGWIGVHSSAGQGSRFSVYLPVPGSECQAAS